MASSYEQKVLEHLEDMLLKHDPQIGPGKRRIAVDSIHLERDEHGEDEVVILFKEVERPRCLFGLRTSIREPLPPNFPAWRRKENENPEGTGPLTDADMIAAKLREHIEAADMGLPQECDENSTTWI